MKYLVTVDNEDNQLIAGIYVRAADKETAIALVQIILRNAKLTAYRRPGK